jgi:hypothetical protein
MTQRALSVTQRSLTQGGGVHGNGFLTRYDVADVAVVEHSHHPVDWEAPNHPLAKREPRRGRRVSLRATFRTAAGDMDCYTVSLTPPSCPSVLCRVPPSGRTP